jgi:hypothetical protein
LTVIKKPIDDFRELLLINNLSRPRKRGASNVKSFWIPAFACLREALRRRQAGMTFLEGAFSLSLTPNVWRCQDFYFSQIQNILLEDRPPIAA